MLSRRLIGICFALGLAIGAAACTSSLSSPTPRSGGGAAAANPVGSTEPAFAVPSVENAREAAIATITGDCHIGAAVTVMRNEATRQALDDKIIAAKAKPESWVVEGELWLGSHDRAAEAFGASKTYSDKTSTWIVVEQSAGAVAYELVNETSASGDVVWSLLNRVMACPPIGPDLDNEADPVYPDD